MGMCYEHSACCTCVCECQETTLITTSNCFVLSFSPKNPSCFTNRTTSSDASGTEWGGGAEGGREEGKERGEGEGRGGKRMTFTATVQHS